ncbi:hypothetical protein [Ancylobacter oerskovii]|uniref:Uncharacterized protein n=1 Tax=Ancylobacter oerskovii TaxID=459519 RepID=A0ABW4YVW1_9HYPH|nr:hypothetical protein [Ancylobacter oerskovii]MBS7544339.1 hypothetical protein [Ancylobacter oerskovii]
MAIPPPLPWTTQDLLEGPVIATLGVVLAAIFGFYGAGPISPAPLAVVTALCWWGQRRRRNAQRGQGHPMLLTYLIQFALMVYVAYGVGSALADQFS